MTVQTSAVRRRLREDQVVEREALETVESTGRQALAEMRRMVGVLREDGAVDGREPAPGLTQLVATRRAVPQRRAAGRRVGHRPRPATGARPRPDRLPTRPGRADQLAAACGLPEPGRGEDRLHRRAPRAGDPRRRATRSPRRPRRGTVCSVCGSGSRSTAATSWPGRGPKAASSCSPRFPWSPHERPSRPIRRGC